MKPPVIVVDTNVIVSALITDQPQSPTCLILDGMLAGRFTFLLSVELLSEYRRVLLRPRIKNIHGLNEDEVDAILSEIVVNGIMRETSGVSGSTLGKGDDHLWALVSVQPGAILVTGDKRLIENHPEYTTALSPRGFIEFSNI
ncbi:MAG: putative toxin-antitoxin system toxin component, PIN family [Deltaproteobacteria bacterium]|nr:putative toxin-antitoxin system toxin component, PIN family [Deltaproteobacteria bacterium]